MVSEESQRSMVPKVYSAPRRFGKAGVLNTIPRTPQGKEHAMGPEEG
jgi:hypothetical protein